ncbi:glycosyltransferase family 4 protein [Bordetella petrii]|uniref:glycosyltransferase family 4 protein n=1 Tax=Bordetella petrii TaxID=94624 RepID=UPI001A975BEC|nr:glycosyltransferase family 4 protein [Bordetella petrii]MBO1111833.1 glycosyltransferase family 4 protein [Bordetella petrii]
MTKCGKPLRILHTEAAMTFGGQEHRVFKEMLAMRERGHHLELVCQSGATLISRMESEGFRVHVIPMAGLKNSITAATQIARILRAGEIDVLNTHSRTDTMAAATAGRFAKTPLIVRTRHLAIPPGSLISYTGLPHRVIAISEHVRDLLVSRGVHTDKVATVMTAINLPDAVQASTLRTELRLSDDDIIIGSVGHMREKKGHADLIAATIPLLRTRPKLHLVIAGRGEPLLTKLKEMVRREGLNDRIHLLGQRDDIANVLAGFNIFALATQNEALGTSYIEAGALGLPLIGTDVGGVSEIVENGSNGFLVPLGDNRLLADALRMLVDNQSLRTSMGHAARTKIRNDVRFSVEHMAEATEHWYYRWLSQSA